MATQVGYSLSSKLERFVLMYKGLETPEKIPLGRVGRADDIAKVRTFRELLWEDNNVSR